MVAISAVMALEALRDQSAEVREVQDTLEREKAVRDDLIRSAREADIPYKRIIEVTGLSRERIWKIGGA